MSKSFLFFCLIFPRLSYSFQSLNPTSQCAQRGQKENVAKMKQANYKLMQTPATHAKKKHGIYFFSTSKIVLFKKCWQENRNWYFGRGTISQVHGLKGLIHTKSVGILMSSKNDPQLGSCRMRWERRAQLAAVKDPCSIVPLDVYVEILKRADRRQNAFSKGLHLDTQIWYIQREGVGQSGKAFSAGSKGFRCGRVRKDVGYALSHP